VTFFDGLILLVVVSWLCVSIVDIARRRHTAIQIGLRLVVRTTVLLAGAYLVFLGLWGLNYRRLRLAEKLQFDATAITPDAARMATMATIDRLNELYAPAHEMGWRRFDAIDPDLAAAFVRADRALGSETAPVVGRPKATLFDFYFRRAGVEGMTDPYFLETLIQQDLLPFERPAVVAHEWSHLAGFADESEANFIGWLTCLRGSVADQYSGWLFLYRELNQAVRPPDRAEMSAQLAPGPRADLQAIAARVRRSLNPRVSAVGWRAYDQYLKANRIEAGTRSYNDVVRLVLGVRFGPEWTPLRR
jgi:hypothetical protein